MPLKLVAILSALICFALAAPPPPKGKAPAAKGAVATKAPAKALPTKAPARPAVAAAKAPAPAVRRPGVAAPAVKSAANSRTPVRGRTTVAPRVANSRAVYSRTPARYARGGGRQVAVAKPQSVVPMQPSQDRYREIQQALVEKGFYTGEVNGVWSTESIEALKTFQRSQNLEPDGKLGSLSLIALGLGPKRLVAAQNNPPPAPPQP